ncbi:Pyoverdine/dityrosine biosynthesis protein [Gigaspora rosea]|uniref:Pyoverdine/dityrosine biosynthesis protein n=1 Tax=Gigaspora rosea TaxID=44941 RepID=A0A397VTX3_9GLOM|nr:Pyoverdine/dityrosine biosynthesis protein [Gigaspora rosea]
MDDSGRVNTLSNLSILENSKETDHGVLIRRILMSGMVKSYQSLSNPEHNQKKSIPYFDFEEYKKQLDEKAKRLKRGKLSDDVGLAVQQIIGILTKKRYRRGPPKHFEVARDDYENRLSEAISKKEKLLLVLPSFPVKCWNPLKVERRMPDLAELNCIGRLYLLCKEIELIYKPGAKIILIADGPIYADIFNEPLNVAIQYKQKVIDFIRQLGLDQYIIMHDMVDLISRNSADFVEAEEVAKMQVETFWRENPNNKHRLMLVENTMSNINVAAYPKDMLRAIFFDTKYNGDIVELNMAKDEICKQTEISAFKYATLLQAINSMELVMKCYPGCIRVTCHPKPGQLGLHLVSPNSRFNFPWNGVGVKKKNGEITVSLEDEVRRDKRYVAVYIEGEEFPFYYEEQ